MRKFCAEHDWDRARFRDIGEVAEQINLDMPILFNETHRLKVATEEGFRLGREVLLEAGFSPGRRGCGGTGVAKFSGGDQAARFQ